LKTFNEPDDRHLGSSSDRNQTLNADPSFAALATTHGRQAHAQELGHFGLIKASQNASGFAAQR